MAQANVALRDDSGAPFSLIDECADHAVLLVFVRHLGCIFCKQQVHLLSEISDPRLMFVSHGDLAAVTEFKRMFAPNQRFVSDPEMELYVKFGLKKGGIGQMLSPRVLLRGLSASGQGMRQSKPMQDPWVLGGWVYIKPGGEATVVHLATDAGEILSKAEAVQLLATGE